MLPLRIGHTTLEGCLKKEPKAQEELYRLCYPVFMKICLRYTRSYDDAANVLQDAFVKIFTKLDTYQGSGDFEGWMRRIVVNAALDHCRKEKKNVMLRGHEITDTHIPDEEETPWITDEHQLLTTIRQLPLMQRTVFNLFVMDNLSHQEIASQLSINTGQSKWYLHDARRILKQQLTTTQDGRSSME